MKTTKKEDNSRILEKPLWVGAHFGFTPIDAPKVTEKDRESVKDCYDDETLEVKGKNLFDVSEKAAFLRMYQEKDFGSLPHPIAVAFKKSEAKKRNEYSFELAGFQGGCAEALLIRTALSALNEVGFTSLSIDLNSIGDKESIAAYERELHNYAKKIGDELDSDLKKRIKKNVYEMLKVVQEGHALHDKMPTSISALSTQSRAHFKEVLEHIEALGTEFRLLPTLVGNRTFCSETLFAVRNVDTGSILALGYRYSRLSKKLGFKKEIPFAGMTLFLSEKPEKSSTEKKEKLYKDIPKPKFYLVQLGKDAKMKTLPLIELLRQNKIPVHHALGRDKITAQLEGAERSRVPYLLIVGQKEALEDSVTIRNTSTRAQDTIYIKDLPQYLKNLPF
jgi:histidyl-tRNA synthetase